MASSSGLVIAAYTVSSFYQGLLQSRNSHQSWKTDTERGQGDQLLQSASPIKRITLINTIISLINTVELSSVLGRTRRKYFLPSQYAYHCKGKKRINASFAMYTQVDDCGACSQRETEELKKFCCRVLCWGYNTRLYSGSGAVL